MAVIPTKAAATSAKGSTEFTADRDRDRGISNSCRVIAVKMTPLVPEPKEEEEVKEEKEKQPEGEDEIQNVSVTGRVTGRAVCASRVIAVVTAETIPPAAMRTHCDAIEFTTSIATTTTGVKNNRCNVGLGNDVVVMPSQDPITFSAYLYCNSSDNAGKGIIMNTRILPTVTFRLDLVLPRGSRENDNSGGLFQIKLCPRTQPVIKYLPSMVTSHVLCMSLDHVDSTGAGTGTGNLIICPLQLGDGGELCLTLTLDLLRPTTAWTECGVGDEVGVGVNTGMMRRIVDCTICGTSLFYHSSYC